MHLNELALILRTVGDASRIRIICHLMKHNGTCVSDIAEELKMSVAIVSHHLQVMAKNDLVVPMRDGKRICYTLPKTKLMNGLRKFICAHAEL